MGRADKVLEALADAAKISKEEKVPYKVHNNMAAAGELNLVSPKADATAIFQSPETVAEYDPALTKISEQMEQPIYIPHLEATKGYGAKALNTLEASAKKRGADYAYLNASPLGGTRGLSQEAAAKKLQEFYKKQGYEVVKDEGTNTIMVKKLGFQGGTPSSTAFSPIPLLKKVYNAYDENYQQPIANAAKRISDTLLPYLDVDPEKRGAKTVAPVLGLGLELAAPDPFSIIGKLAKGATMLKAAGPIAKSLQGEARAEKLAPKVADIVNVWRKGGVINVEKVSADQIAHLDRLKDAGVVPTTAGFRVKGK